MKTIGSVKLADVLGISPKEIAALVKSGMPREGNRFSLAHCLVWFVRHQRNLLDRSTDATDRADSDAWHSVRQRLISTQADHAESELKISSGDHVDRDAVQLLVLNKLRTVRENVMGLAGRYGYRLAASSNEEILSVLLKASEEVLSNLRGSVVDAYLESRSKNGGQNARTIPTVEA